MKKEKAARLLQNVYTFAPIPHDANRGSGV